MAAKRNTAPWAVIILAAFALCGCVQSDGGTYENGTVLAATPVDQPGQTTGAGAIAGMVILGSAGGAVGAGAGKALAVAGGIIAGAAIGQAAEAASQTHDGIAYTVRLTDRRVLTVVEHVNPGDRVFGVGAPVVLETNGNEQQILPWS